MDAVQFRKAQPGNLSIMQGIARRTIDKSYRSFLGDEGVDSFINSGESDRELQNHIDNCDVALREDVIVGFSIYFDDLIHLMMVDVACIVPASVRCFLLILKVSSSVAAIRLFGLRRLKGIIRQSTST
jgi:hypothetical protein